MSWDLLLLEKSSELKELLDFSSKLGNKELIIAKQFSSKQEALELRQQLPKNHLICFLVTRPDLRSARKFSSVVDLVAVLGGSIELNKFALSNKAVDLLLCPSPAGRLAFDASNARIAAASKKPIAFLFSPFLNERELRRASLFRNNFFTAKLLKKHKANALVFSGARNWSETRKATDLKHFLVLLGFSKAQSERFNGCFANSFFGKKVRE